MAKKVLGIVPARSGSKGIPLKNVVRLNGQPLISYTLKALSQSRLLNDHLVSTDSSYIAKIAAKYGGRVPFLRSKELARDDTNIVAVINDILAHVGESYDFLMLLQPTAPLRAASDIDNCIRLASEKAADNVVSFRRMETYHPWYMYYWADNKLEQIHRTPPGLRRQDFPPVLWRNGAIYLIKTEVFKKEQSLVTDRCVPYIMPAERSVNIDAAEDLALAEFFLRVKKYEGVNSGAGRF